MDEQKIIVALSGGVDSAVTALLLQQQGFEVQGVFMLNWSEVGEGCNWEWDYESAKLVADHLEIPLELWNFEDVYRKEVYEPFIAAFERGETPNPDVICNRYVKFGAFLDKARTEGADWVATGHYARIAPMTPSLNLPLSRGRNLNEEAQNVPLPSKGEGGGEGVKPGERILNRNLSLLAGVDPSKDQSYFLATLSQEQLKYILFPLGGLTKKEVRQIAHAFRLPNAGRRDSYGICFIGERQLEEFLRSRVRHAKGPMVTVEGERVGEHEGLPFYTIGQRKGIGIGGRGPFYVVEKRVEGNTLIVAQGDDHPALFSECAVVSEMYWIHGEPEMPFHCQVRHRHLQALQEAAVDRKGDRYMVKFRELQRAVTPGQFLAVYREEECLGGGVIGNPKTQFPNPPANACHQSNNHSLRFVR